MRDFRSHWVPPGALFPFVITEARENTQLDCREPPGFCIALYLTSAAASADAVVQHWDFVQFHRQYAWDCNPNRLWWNRVHGVPHLHLHVSRNDGLTSVHSTFTRVRLLLLQTYQEWGICKHSGWDVLFPLGDVLGSGEICEDALATSMPGAAITNWACPTTCTTDNCNTFTHKYM
jgi:hypothetical protein